MQSGRGSGGEGCSLGGGLEVRGAVWEGVWRLGVRSGRGSGGEGCGLGGGLEVRVQSGRG